VPACTSSSLRRQAPQPTQATTDHRAAAEQPQLLLEDGAADTAAELSDVPSLVAQQRTSHDVAHELVLVQQLAARLRARGRPKSLPARQVRAGRGGPAGRVCVGVPRQLRGAAPSKAGCAIP
jgi:hypothetical protein